MISELLHLGLSDEEARVYLAMLEVNGGPVSVIARKAGVHRVSTYDILEALMGKGLVETVVKGKKRLIVPVAPEKISENLRLKQEQFVQILPELKAIQNKGGAQPKVLYFQGRQQVWNAYLDRIRHQPENKENLVYGSSAKLLQTFPEEYQRFTQERLTKGIKAKIIVEQSEEGRKEAATANQELREVRFLPAGRNFTANTIIYGNRVMTVSWDSLIAVIVEDANNAANQRQVFELLWQYLP